MTAIVYSLCTARDCWQEYTVLGGVNVDPDVPEHISRQLRPFAEALHADCSSGFNGLYQPSVGSGAAMLLPVGCWAHARREIVKVQHRGLGLVRDVVDRVVRLAEAVGERLRRRNRCASRSRSSAGRDHRS